MKKILSVLLLLCMLFSAASCGAQPVQTDPEPQTELPAEVQTEEEPAADDAVLLSRQREYAQLITERGLGLHDGQKLLIEAQAECYEFTELCVEAAYAAGVDDVIVLYSDAANSRQRYLYADDTVLGEYPSYRDELYRQCLEEKIPVLILRSIHPGELSDVDPDRLALANSAVGENSLAYDEANMNNEIAWVVAGVPNELWAETVFPGLSSEEALAKLWDAVLDSVYADGSGDAGALWDGHIDTLGQNAEKLTELHFKSLHYTNSLGTDLTVELPEDAVWCMAEMSTPEGETFAANIPSEEVFTSPLAKCANGVVYASLPLELGGTLVTDIRLTVQDGRIVDSYASAGLEVLNTYLDCDEGARYFGEIALVPYDSPISQSGILFYDTLYDENASCHIAFGDSYAECLRDGLSMTAEQLEAAGLNRSDTHIDFMIGTADMKIVGTTYDGEEIVIFENGNFTDIFS